MGLAVEDSKLHLRGVGGYSVCVRINKRTQAYDKYQVSALWVSDHLPMSPGPQSGVGGVVGLIDLACFVEGVCGYEIRPAVSEEHLMRGENRRGNWCSDWRGSGWLLREGWRRKNQQGCEKAEFHVVPTFVRRLRRILRARILRSTHEVPFNLLSSAKNPPPAP